MDLSSYIKEKFSSINVKNVGGFFMCEVFGLDLPVFLFIVVVVAVASYLIGGMMIEATRQDKKGK